MSDIELTRHLLDLEEQRCRAIVEERYDQLSNILSDRLIHTHTRGNHDGKQQYLAYLQGVLQILDLRRKDLRVIQLGDSAAVMHGHQLNRVRLRGTQEEGSVEAMATQTWAQEADGQWRLLAFHACSLSAPHSPGR